MFAVIDAFGHASIHNVATGRVTGPQWMDEIATVYHVVFSPDGRHIYVDANDYKSGFPGFFTGRIEPGLTCGIWDLQTSKRVIKTEPLGEMPAAFSPDGRFIAMQCHPGFRLVRIKPDAPAVK